MTEVCDTEDHGRPQSLGCAPSTRERRSHALLYRPGEAPATGQTAPKQNLRFLQQSDIWRRQTMEGRRHIPAGYTYLAQLMGHDIGSSVRLSHLPWVAPSDAEGPAGAVGHNLIENPLTLETVYGPGPGFATHLYDPRTLRFRLDPHARIANTFGQGDGMIRALYDERNRDTPMLHELTVAIMQCHNRCAERLSEAGLSPMEAYGLSRAHLVKRWHHILRHDLLPVFVDPETAQGPLDPAFALDEVTLLHGLFRTFHALPLRHYPMTARSVQRLPDLMKSGFQPSDAESFGWTIDWPFFFARPDDDVTLGTMPKPLTGLCFSAERRLMGPLGRCLMVADQDSARRMGALRIDSDEMKEARQHLRDDTAAPDRLAAGIAAMPGAPEVTAEMFAKAPIFVALLAEAQLSGPEGRFGPLGAALLKASMDASMARVRFAPATEDRLAELADLLPQPETMLALIQEGRNITP